MLSPVQFPSKDVIVSYLEQHPATKDRFFSDKKITEAVATVFAHQQYYTGGVDMAIALTMNDESEKLGLSDEIFYLVSANLKIALMDCANGKPIASEKPNETSDK